MDTNYRIPHKTFVPARLVTMSLKLPRTMTQKKISKSTFSFLRTGLNQNQTKTNIFNNFEALETLHQGRWMVPQRMDSSSPEGKKLVILIEKLKSESRIARLNKRTSPNIIFSKQTQRLPLPQPIFHSEKRKISVSPLRPKSRKKSKTKIVFAKENIIREIELISRHSNPKLKSTLLSLAQSLTSKT